MDTTLKVLITVIIMCLVTVRLSLLVVEKARPFSLTERVAETLYHSAFVGVITSGVLSMLYIVWSM